MGPKETWFRDIHYVHVRVSFDVLRKMFEALTICRNTSVQTSHHGFTDAFQLIQSVPDITNVNRLRSHNSSTLGTSVE